MLNRYQDFFNALLESAPSDKRRPKTKGGFYHFLMPGNRVWLTCCNCALLCVPDREERNRRFKVLRNSGVVIQETDGTLRAVTPEAAIERLNAMSPEERSIYEPIRTDES
jgi:epoxyqueuosine reductase